MSRPGLVHWRAPMYLLHSARSAGLAYEPLAERLGFGPQALGRTKWVSWDDYCELIDGLEDLMGGVEPLARLTIDHPTFSDLRPIARAFIAPVQLFRLIFEVLDPIAFPSVKFEFEARSETDVRIAYTIHPSGRPCLGLAYGSLGSIRAIPMHLDLPLAEARATLDERSAEYMVTLPPSQTLLARGLRVARQAADSLLGLTHELVDDVNHADAAKTDIAERLLRLSEAHALTPRQTEVLELLVQGHANRDMAARLGCSEGTLELHVSQLLRKLGCSSRAQVIARFWQ